MADLFNGLSVRFEDVGLLLGRKYDEPIKQCCSADRVSVVSP